MDAKLSGIVDRFARELGDYFDGDMISVVGILELMKQTIVTFLSIDSLKSLLKE